MIASGDIASKKVDPTSSFDFMTSTVLWMGGSKYAKEWRDYQHNNVNIVWAKFHSMWAHSEAKVIDCYEVSTALTAAGYFG